MLRLACLSPTLGSGSRRWQGSRNILVHGYIALHLVLVVGALHQLDDFTAFALAVAMFLDANPEI